MSDYYKTNTLALAPCTKTTTSLFSTGSTHKWKKILPVLLTRPTQITYLISSSIQNSNNEQATTKNETLKRFLLCSMDVLFEHSKKMLRNKI